MTKWLLAWWFVYSLLNAQGETLQVAAVGPFDTDIACQRLRAEIITRLQRPGAHFAVEQCVPDRVERAPR